jgi:hypothetical protein
MFNSRSIGTFPTSNRRMPRNVWDDNEIKMATPPLPRLVNSPGKAYGSSTLSYQPLSRTPYTCEHCGNKFFSLKNKIAHQSNCWRKRDNDLKWVDEFRRIKEDNDNADYANFLPDIFTASGRAQQSINNMVPYTNMYNYYMSNRPKLESEKSKSQKSFANLKTNEVYFKLDACEKVIFA